MKFEEYQEWVKMFYKKRGWYNYSPFIRCNFLTEEVGELAQAIRKKVTLSQVFRVTNVEF